MAELQSLLLNLKDLDKQTEEIYSKVIAVIKRISRLWSGPIGQRARRDNKNVRTENWSSNAQIFVTDEITSLGRPNLNEKFQKLRYTANNLYYLVDVLKKRVSETKAKLYGVVHRYAFVDENKLHRTETNATCGSTDTNGDNERFDLSELQRIVKDTANAQEFLQFCRRRRPEELKIIDSIAVCGKTLTRETIQNIQEIVKCCHHCVELEFRSCDHNALDPICDPTGLSDYQIVKLPSGATSSSKFSTLVGAATNFALCGVVKTLRMKQTGLASQRIEHITEFRADVGRNPCIQKSLDRTWIKMCLTTLDISYYKNINDFSLLGTALCGSNILHLKMVNCDLKDEQMLKLHQSVKHGMITHLNISYNDSLTETGYESVCGILSCYLVENLIISGCEITKSSFSAIDKSLSKDAQIVSFDLSYNGPVNGSWIKEMCTLFRRRLVSIASVAGCDLAPSHIDCLEEALISCQLKSLDMSDNPALRSVLKRVGIIVRRCKLQAFGYADCMSGYHHIRQFIEGLEGWKVARLNFSDWERNVTREFVESIGPLIPVIGKELKLCCENYGEESERIIQNKIDEQASKDLEVVLDEGNKETIEVSGITIVLRKSHKDVILRKRCPKLNIVQNNGTIEQ